MDRRTRRRQHGVAKRQAARESERADAITITEWDRAYQRERADVARRVMTPAPDVVAVGVVTGSVSLPLMSFQSLPVVYALLQAGESMHQHMAELELRALLGLPVEVRE